MRGAVSLIAELMPRRANVLLIQAGAILDCLNRVGPEDNRYRLSLPNHDYVPPPPLQGQIHPARVTAADLGQLLDSAEKDSHQARRLLPGRVHGISPLMAKEIVFRATGDSQSAARNTSRDSLYDALQEVIAPLLRRDWQPGIGISKGVPAEVSVFPLRHLKWQSCQTISGAIDHFSASASSADAYKSAKQPAGAAIDETKAKLSAKLASLQRGLRDESELEQLRQSGELILAYQYAIADGQEELRAHYDVNAPALIIQLDPQRSPLENAQDYFRRYEKAKGALDAVPALIAETRTELRYIEQLESDLTIASDWLEIDDVIQSLQSRGHWRGKQLKRLGGRRSGPLRLVSRDGYVIFIGRNSQQNEAVTFKSANPNDIWLHVRDAPGAHVVIRNDGRRIKEELIAEVAAVAAYYSKRRQEARVQVNYTRVKYVKAIKGAGPGMVAYRNESSVLVRPQDENILK